MAAAAGGADVCVRSLKSQKSFFALLLILLHVAAVHFAPADHGGKGF